MDERSDHDICKDIRRLSPGYEGTYPKETEWMPKGEGTAAKRRCGRFMEIDLKKDLLSRGCPVCDHIEKRLFDFFAHYQFALASDEKTQQDFADEGGLCPFHIWQLAEVSSNRGLAKGLPDFLFRTADDLMRLAEDPSQPDSMNHTFINDSSQCHVCDRLRQLEGEYIHLLADFLQKEDGRQAYLSSHGVCLRHLKLLLAASRTGEIRRFLLFAAAHRFRDLKKDLNHYAQKEARQRYALTRDEKDAVRRALIHMAGAKYVCYLS